jgi:hypothetical protein
VCYACGLKAHKAGDPNCKAGPFDVASVAPKEFRDRREAKKRKSEGGAQQGNAKKTKANGARNLALTSPRAIAKEGPRANLSMKKLLVKREMGSRLAQSKRRR